MYRFGFDNFEDDTILKPNLWFDDSSPFITHLPSSWHELLSRVGNAVKRNKIKRRLRNIMNDAIKTLNLNLNYSYLFIAKKNIYDANYKMIKDSIFRDLIKVR